MHNRRPLRVALCIIWGGVLEWGDGVEYWSGIILPSIQTKPGHILENTKNINFHSAGVGVSSYQT